MRATVTMHMTIDEKGHNLTGWSAFMSIYEGSEKVQHT